MKFTVKTPDITQYRFAFEPEDDLHHRCMWADINLDHDTYTMTATTDCGNYSYWWKATPKTESFRELMARINGDYLLDKISRRNRFNFKESRRKLLTEAKMEDCDEKQINAIEQMDECESVEMYLRLAEEITELDYCSIPVVMEYPAGAVTFVDIFVKYLQPLLREGLK